MSLVGLSRIQLVAQHIIEVGDECRVLEPTLVRGNLLYGIVLPQSVVATECLETRLNRHAGAGKKYDVLHNYIIVFATSARPCRCRWSVVHDLRLPTYMP